MKEFKADRVLVAADTCEHCYHREKRPDCQVAFYYDQNDQDRCCKCDHARKYGDR